MDDQKLLRMLLSNDTEMLELGIMSLMATNYDDRKRFINSHFTRFRSGKYFSFSRKGAYFISSGKVYIRGEHCCRIMHGIIYFHHIRSGLIMSGLEEKVYL